MSSPAGEATGVTAPERTAVPHDNVALGRSGSSDRPGSPEGAESPASAVAPGRVAAPADPASAHPGPARRGGGAAPAVLVAAALATALVAVFLAAITIGPVPTPLGDALAALATPPIRWLEQHGIGVGPLASVAAVPSDATLNLVWSIRLPRVLLALIVGSGLAVAGSVMQAVFRNPLAEPGVTGVSSGAAVVAVLMIVTGVSSFAPWMLPVGAFAGALVTVTVVQAIAGRRGGAATLLLVGIALNAFLGAGISAIIANAPTSDHAQQAIFWLNGDLTAANWRDLSLAVIPIVVGTAVLLGCIPELNMFLLSEESAAAAGVNTTTTRHLLLALAALVTAAGVAVTGVISFVGLVVPHVVRLVLGPDHRRLVPVSVVGGGIFLVLADLVARNLFNPVVLQTGTVTAFIGAPVLLYLVLRRARA